MRPNISEFSYGYAITDELIHWHGTHVTAAPVFPSLIREGKPGGGWDVMLKRRGIPLFLQFKLADCMSRKSAHEYQEGWFSTPFFRMHLRPARFSEQHQMLLDLERDGNEVYYSAPVFHQPWELNEAYLTHEVKIRSIWIPPSWIGPLDRRDHHVAFQDSRNKRLCSSDSKFIEQDASFESFAKRIISSIEERGANALSEKGLRRMAGLITEISASRRDIPIDVFQRTRATTESLPPIEQIAFYSSMFIGAQLFVVTEFDDDLDADNGGG